MKKTPNERLRQFREAVDLSTTQLAAATMISKSLIEKMEAGSENVSMKTAKLLFSIFRLPIEWLIDGEGEMKYEYEKAVTQPERVNVSLPWKDEAYAILKEQLAKKDQVIDTLSSILSRANFPQGLNESAPMQLMR